MKIGAAGQLFLRDTKARPKFSDSSADLSSNIRWHAHHRGHVTTTGLHTIVFTSMLEFTSDPARSASRAEALDEYFRAHVLDGSRFVCSSSTACRDSHDGAFYEGQAHHVGRHFDLSIGTQPVRLVVTGQEYGSPPAHVTREARSEMIVDGVGLRRRFIRDADHQPRNPHMRGTTSLLRLVLGNGLGTDHAGEFIDVGLERVHVFECFALVNFLLCSALADQAVSSLPAAGRGSAPGRSTSLMQRNCAAHYRQTLEVLEPTIIVAQGKGVRRWMSRVLDAAAAVSSDLPVERVRIGAVECYLATFAHPAVPSRENWGMNARQPYLTGVVVPTIELLWKLVGARPTATFS